MTERRRQAPYSNKPIVAQYYNVTTFFQRLGLQSKLNKNSEHLESFLILPTQVTVGRIFQVDDLIAVQFYQPIASIVPKLKGSSIQPEALEPIKIEHLLGYLLTQFLNLPVLPVQASGYVIAVGGQN